MTAATNKALVHDYYEVLDAGDIAGGAAFLAPGYAYHGENHTGVDDYAPGVQARVFYTAFPDFRHVIEDQIAEGDFVVNRIRYFATHLGEFMGIPATGRSVTWTGMDMARFEHGKVVERWGVYDALGLRRQLLGETPISP